MKGSRMGIGTGRRHLQAWLLVLLTLSVGLLAYSRAGDWVRGVHFDGATPRPVAVRGDLAGDERSTISLFREVAPSVVYVTSVSTFRPCFYCRAVEVPQGTGSGFIWDRSGYIVTNFHVLAEADRARVTLMDHSTWQARLVGIDPDKDIAVLKIDAPAQLLPPIPLGSSDDLEVGQRVFAIGNPFGYDQTLTMGIISGLGREITSSTNRPIRGVIQTDAAINPGNSGGPLLDSAGRVIGMNTAVLSPSGAYAGIGFAVPVASVNRIVPRIIRGQQIERPRLGAITAEDHLTRRLGLEGVLILTVAPDGSAEKAGLRPTRLDDDGRIVFGDCIIAIDGSAVATTDDLFSIIDEHEVGDTLPFTILREEEEIRLPVTLESLN